MKRISQVFLVVVALATAVWFTRNFKVVKIPPTGANQTQSQDDTGQPAHDSSDGTIVPESPRHSARAIEQHQQNRLAALDEAVRLQEDKVEQRRKVLANIVRTKGIIYKGENSFYSQSGVDEDQRARTALQTFNQLEQEKMQLSVQIQSLLRYTGEQLMVYAAGVNLPDNTIKTGYPRYLEAKRELQRLQSSGLGSDHRSVKAAAEVITLKRELDEATVNLRETLQTQLAMAEDRLDTVAKNRKNDTQRGLDAQDYVGAKRNFEADQQLLQEMKLKLITEKLREKTEQGGR